MERALDNANDKQKTPASGQASGGDTVLELFQTAALLLGDQQEAITIVEKAVSHTQADPCADPAAAAAEGHALLVRLAIERAIALAPMAFNPENVSAGPGVCFDTDDLEGTGVQASQLTQLAAGSGRAQLRDWLEHLHPEARVIFVLRGMLGEDSEKVALELQRAGGGAGWSAAQVGQVYRGALCSLAGSLAHAPIHA